MPDKTKFPWSWIEHLKRLFSSSDRESDQTEGLQSEIVAQSQAVLQEGDGSTDADGLVAGSTEFALALYRAIRSQGVNLFLSPYSLTSALAMTYAGARGDTLAQMSTVLHYDMPPLRLHSAFQALNAQLVGDTTGAQPFQLSLASALWGQQDFFFLAEFLDLLERYYGAGLSQVDFKADPEGARSRINAWVEERTQHKISDLIPAGGVDNQTRLVLANAVYFKADWLHPFEQRLTQPGTFTRLDGSTVQAKMMETSAAKQLGYFAGDGLVAVDLPYRGGEVSMLIVVPDSGRFAEIEEGLDAARLQTILSGLAGSAVNLTLPKFKFAAAFEMSAALAAMGMPDAFCGGNTDFSGMDGQGELCISRIFHKAFVAVDEQGTEAAAATAVVMTMKAMLIQQTVDLVVDRPFLFAIRHQPSGAILFLGRVLDPAVSA